nr:hypothetical protein [Dyella sp. ASV24]
MRHEFSEVLNDLIDCVLLGDIKLLRRYKAEHRLSDDLASEFVTNNSGDQAVLDGIVIPMAGIANHPYTVIFNLSDEIPQLLQEGSKLHHRRDGYVLCVEHGQVMLFTWRILQNFTSDTLDRLLERYREPGRPVIELKNGWYEVDILGGEILRNGCLEPAFEFVLKKTAVQGDASQVDTGYLFTIHC